MDGIKNKQVLQTHARRFTDDGTDNGTDVVLQHGDSAAIERLETDLLLEGLHQVHGADFRGFVRTSLMRRLRAVMLVEGLATISALQNHILRSRVHAEALVRALSLRPGGLFDDPEGMQALRAVLGPYLRSCPLPKIWIAESTSAEDVFALVILLIEEGLYDKTLIFVTGADEALLAETRLGSIDGAQLPRYEADYLRSGGTRSLQDYGTLQQDGQFVFASTLRSNLIWAQYNLATDRSFNEFQFIICKRVLPEFGPLLRRRSLHLFADSLSPFGILSVDVPEDLDSAPMALRFQAVVRERGLYRRMA